MHRSIHNYRYLLTFGALLCAFGCAPAIQSEAADGNEWTNHDDHLESYPRMGALLDEYWPESARGSLPVNPDLSVVRDINGDQRDDLILYNDIGVVVIGLSNGLTVFDTTDVLTFTWLEPIPVASYDSLLLADVTGDGRQEFIINELDRITIHTLDENSSKLREFASIGAGDNPNMSPKPAVVCHVSQRYFADMTGDGRADLICPAGAISDNEVIEGIFDIFLTVYPLQADGSLGEARRTKACETCGLGRLRFGDFDGDGNRDLVALRTAIDTSTPGETKYSVVVHYGDGAGGFSQAVQVGGDEYLGSNPKVADFDGDGRDDIVLQFEPCYSQDCSETDESFVDGAVPTVFYGGVDRKFDRSQSDDANLVIHNKVGNFTQLVEDDQVTVGDLDGDGLDELILLGSDKDIVDRTHIYNPGYLRILKGSSKGLEFSSNTLILDRYEYLLRGRPEILAGDFAGNGRAQLLLVEPNTTSYRNFRLK